MISRALKIVMMAAGIIGATGATAAAQDLETFKKRMADATNMTKVDMDEALRMYLEIRTVFGGAEADFSVARAYQRLNQCEMAKQYYSAVMQYNLSEKHPIYQRAASAFDEISSCESWQKFYLTCEIPEGAHVEIDNERVSSCWSRGYTMAPGEHTFKLVSADGREVVEKRTSKAGGAQERIVLKFPVEKVEVERVVEMERSYVYEERFHPALYWGLIVGGVALAAGSGFFLGYANNAYAEEQKYADIFAVTGDLDAKQKASDARDRVKLGNILMYSFAGAGAAVAISGVALAIVSAVSEKERVEVTNGVSAYVTPTLDGVSFGVGMKF